MQGNELRKKKEKKFQLKNQRFRKNHRGGHRTRARALYKHNAPDLWDRGSIINKNQDQEVDTKVLQYSTVLLVGRALLVIVFCSPDAIYCVWYVWYGMVWYVLSSHVAEYGSKPGKVASPARG